MDQWEDLPETDLPAVPGGDSSLGSCAARFAASDAAAGDARGFAARQLTAWGCESTVLEAVTLIASELVTNAVDAARRLDGGTLRMALRRLPDQRVRVGVWDELAATIPHPADPPKKEGGDGLLAEDGRGLRLVAAFAECWGVSYHSSGTEVWARVAPVREMLPNFPQPAAPRRVAVAAPPRRGLRDAAGAVPCAA
jgi:anti-sigma regulatory factor (Ser/Thr protein kinase)